MTTAKLHHQTSPKPKILHICKNGGYSGAEKIAITIIEGSKEEYDAVYASPKGYVCEVLREKGIFFHSLGEKLTIRSVRKAVNDVKPDIIHAHDYRASIIAGIVAGKKIVVISHLHNNAPWIRRHGVKTLGYAAVSVFFYRVIAVSPSIVYEFAFSNIIKKRCVIEENPVDAQKIKKMANEESFFEPFDIIFLGRLEEAKNPLGFVDIVELVSEVLPETRAVMVGDGSMVQSVKGRIREKHLGTVIEMKGYLSNPYTVLRHSKILCMPSKWEGYGLSAAEALVLGKPVVCLDAGGLRYFVDDKCGKICANLKECASEVISLLSDEHEYRSKMINAKKKGENFCSPDEYAIRIKKIYREAIGGESLE